MAGALHNPKGKQSHSKKPKLPTLKAVYCFDASSIFICQNPDFRVQARKMSSTYQAVQHFLNPQKGVGVFLHMGIKMAEVNTEVEASVFLSDQH